MKGKTLTLIVSVFIVVASLAYDAVIIYLYGTEASISWGVIEYSKEHTLIPFLMGILCGHFFWPIKPTKGWLQRMQFSTYSQIRMWVKEIDSERQDKLENYK